MLCKYQTNPYLYMCYDHSMLSLMHASYLVINLKILRPWHCSFVIYLSAELILPFMWLRSPPPTKCNFRLSQSAYQISAQAKCVAAWLCLDHVTCLYLICLLVVNLIVSAFPADHNSLKAKPNCTHWFFIYTKLVVCIIVDGLNLIGQNWP